MLAKTSETGSFATMVRSRPPLSQLSVVERLQAKEVFFWSNPNWRTAEQSLHLLSYGLSQIEDAEARLQRFSQLLAMLFPELQASNGVIESPLLPVAGWAEKKFGIDSRDTGSYWIKADHQLPVAGSIKARGGIYSVLCFAEKIALESGLLQMGDNYVCLLKPAFRRLFETHELSVGSTGNLDRKSVV